jgi:glycosyl hydrolase family 16
MARVVPVLTGLSSTGSRAISPRSSQSSLCGDGPLMSDPRVPETSISHHRRGRSARARVGPRQARRAARLILLAMTMVLLGTGIWVGDSMFSDRSTSAASDYTMQRPAAAIGATDSVRNANVPMAAPAGYTAQQMIFDDQFSGTTLDATKWSSFLGAQGGAWNDNGNLPAPYSGPNTPITEDAAMFGPSQVSVDNGLTLTATRNTNQYADSYPWISGVVTTEGKFSLPLGGWYVQVKAKMPDQTQGMWPAIWFLPGVPGTAANEFDGYEGGFVGANPNQTMHSNYFADQGPEQKNYSVKSDVTAGYHVYGFRFIPGHSITAYFDGRQVWQVEASSGVTITPEPYEIILELQVAGPGATWWHSGTTVATGSSSMDIAEVRAYSDS